MILFAIALTIGAYVYVAVPDCLRHAQICFQSSDLAPYRYRVLVPALERLLAPDGSIERVILSDVMLQSLLLIAIFTAVHIWLLEWVNPDRALLGVFVLAGVFLFAYHFYMRAINTTVELAVVAWGLVLLKRMSSNEKTRQLENPNRTGI